MVTLREQLRSLDLKWAAICSACDPFGKALCGAVSKGNAFRAANEHRRDKRSHGNFITIRLAKEA